MKNKFEKLCFGLGDFATNGMYTVIGTYILFFYTDIEKLDLSVVSMIFVMLAQLIDCMQAAHHIRPQGTMTSVALFIYK